MLRLLAFLIICETTAAGQVSVLLRNAAAVSARTSQGDFPVALRPVTPSREVTLIVLTDTLSVEDGPRIQKSLFAALNVAFLKAHTLRVIPVSVSSQEAGVALTTTPQIAAALARIIAPAAPNANSSELFSTLVSLAPTLPSNWGRVVVIGRLPAVGSAESNWISAALAYVYGKQRVSVSFWSLDGSVPEWAQNLCAATAGLLATSDFTALLPVLNETAALFAEASWPGHLSAGAWPSKVEFYNATNERVSSISTLLSASGFVPPMGGYLAARKAMQDEASARSVLALNPSDLDALGKLGQIDAAQRRPKESAVLWQRILEVTPQDGNAIAQLALQDVAAEDYDAAGLALERAERLGFNNRFTLEAKTRLLMHGNKCSEALPILEQALAFDKADQSLWLLRADCADKLQRWPLTAESLEHAISLGPVPLERRTALITGYLSAGNQEHALLQLQLATAALPRDAAVETQYAGFWDLAGESPSAIKLWQSALAIDAKFEAAYVGLAQHYLNHRQPKEAMKASDDGLDVLPGSARLVLIKVTALEANGDSYGARRFLRDHAAGTNQVELLKRWAHIEDCCGSQGAAAYLALLNALLESKAAQAEINEFSQRGLMVALRTEQMGAAKTFADRMALNGDRSGLALLDAGKTVSEAHVDLLGGADALHFLILGGTKAKADQMLLDYSRVLTALTLAGKPGHAAIVEKIHDYFRILAAVSALGTRKADHFEVLLSLNNKQDKQRTEKVFNILGLKLKNGKEGVTVGSSEGKSQVRKQDTLAALAIDDTGIEEALAKHGSYTFEIPVDSIPLFPSADLWRQGFAGHDSLPGGLFELFLTDERLPQLYTGLNSMDRKAAEALLAVIPLRTLADRYCAPLSLYSASLALHGTAVEVPGGAAAHAVWQQMTGVSPTSAAAFFQALLSKDEGRLLAFFYTLSQLDRAHQQFFTRSEARARRFYDLYRESPEMRRSDRQLGSASSFTSFIREVPLADDGSVDFPGAAEVWMVAKGSSTSGGSVAKLTKKIKRSVAPDDEDQILIRLASTEYKSDSRQHSELANFIAVARIDAERDHPLDQSAALLLAQGFAQYGGLYTYFAELGDLEASDYQKAFSLEAKLNGADPVTSNHMLAEVHAFLAILGLLRESGAAQPNDVLKLYRDVLARYLEAPDASSRTVASLKAIDDLLRLNKQKAPTRDEGMRSLLLGEPIGNTGARGKAFQQLLALQKVPSLDSLFAVWLALPKITDSPAALDEVQSQLAKLEVLTPPKTWKISGERRKHLDSFQSAEALSTVSKLRERLAKKKRNPADIEKLSSQLLAELEPWVRLAMVGQIYARFLDPTDLVVSEDAMLLRKHEFLDLGPVISKRELFAESDMAISSEGEGSYFAGGLAQFSLTAGRARAEGNHLGGAGGGFMAGALFASVRATDWNAVTSPELRSFGATVRLAREWIVDSAVSPKMFDELERDTLGLLSLVRRKALLEAVQHHAWLNVWQSVSVSDLHFLGDALIETAPADLWNSEELKSLKLSSAHSRELNALGSVAPQLSGCTQPRLRRYEPYEEYQRHLMPGLLAQRLSELKLYLAILADDSAWRLEALPLLASRVADNLASKGMMRDNWDWAGVLDSYRKLRAEELEPLLNP